MHLNTTITEATQLQDPPAANIRREGADKEITIKENRMKEKRLQQKEKERKSTRDLLLQTQNTTEMILLKESIHHQKMRVTKVTLVVMLLLRVESVARRMQVICRTELESS